MLLPLWIDLISSPKNVYSRNLDSLCFVYFQNVLFESREASQLILRVSPIFLRIFCLRLQFCNEQLVGSILMIYIVAIRPYAFHMFPQS
jgi:hypothetical protein